MNGVERIFLRPIGNPLPLGFLALAGATLLVSALQLGWIDATQGTDVALVLIGRRTVLPTGVAAPGGTSFTSPDYAHSSEAVPILGLGH